MKKILAFNGSIRQGSNSTILLRRFLEGAKTNSDFVEELSAADLDLKYCTGCLRCNLVKRCAIRGDDWENISHKIIEADVLVFSSPVYFHHVSAQLKKLIDRFRSFLHVQITEGGVVHTPISLWKKDIVLILSMGSSDDVDAQPVVDLFSFIQSIIAPDNKLHVIKGTRLAVINHVSKSEEELRELYNKLQLPEELAGDDFSRNSKLLKHCHNLGSQLAIG